MARRNVWCIVSAALALSPMTALAQSPAPEITREFVTFLRSNPYATYVLERLHEHEPPPLKAECAELKLVSRKNLAIIAQPQFAPGSVVPERGQWVDQAIVDRCGQRVQRNVLIVARATGFQAFALLPGQTVASPVLQRDALLTAMIAATARIGCDNKATSVVNTAVSGSVTPGAPWAEDWTFAGCGKTVVITLAFSPDGKGGTSFSTTVRP